MTATAPQRRTFLGVPIEGDIIPSHELPPQRPLSELEPLLQALLDDPTIVAFGWNQYTPYFNDGDECIFSVEFLWVQTDQDADPHDLYSGIETYDLAFNINANLGKRPAIYDPIAKEYVEQPYGGPDETRYDRCAAVSEAIGSGAFDVALLEKFGDHAEITIDRSQITITEHDHQ